MLLVGRFVCWPANLAVTSLRCVQPVSRVNGMRIRYGLGFRSKLQLPRSAGSRRRGSCPVLGLAGCRAEASPGWSGPCAPSVFRGGPVPSRVSAPPLGSARRCMGWGSCDRFGRFRGMEPGYSTVARHHSLPALRRNARTALGTRSARCPSSLLFRNCGVDHRVPERLLVPILSGGRIDNGNHDSCRVRAARLRRRFRLKCRNLLLNMPCAERLRPRGCDRRFVPVRSRGPVRSARASKVRLRS
ncbi:hypothetical protein DFR68_11095 [Nocardia mexicana]|uniref:Uncharacterized protein n=1 Tax=Nocardia mexicana TaxID=279262 RepID=A0A370GTQ4_9NOCA|nr:hypothetical protein DFR68_11095 [Nocardia mexicana]